MPGPGLDLVGDEELAQITEVIRSGQLTRYGPDDDTFPAKVRTFEQAVAERAGVGHALAVNSGTTGLLLALSGLGVGPGDEVIVPGFTYVATISSVVYARAVPVLAEVDATFNLDPVDVEARITPRTRAIVVVHMLGAAARIEELKAVAERHDLALIEDAAQAFGATYQGRWLGSFGDVGAYSFNEYKTITCGDGGMLVTSDDELYARAFAMHDQGQMPVGNGVGVGPEPMLGLNFRMTELGGAMLLAQLAKLDRIREHLHNNRDTVWSLLASLPGLGFRELVDRDGDSATHLVLVYPDAEVAAAVSERLGSITLDHSGWYVYSQMQHLLERRTVTGRGCPFDCECHDGSASYEVGMLPATDALLARSMSFAIGVLDPNLAPFGLRMRDSAEVARRRAEAFIEAYREVMG
jgi:dTDP-4-amino-4,6-dideoxygalactose transaminase